MPHTFILSCSAALAFGFLPPAAGQTAASVDRRDQAEEESTNNIQNYISYLIDLQEQFNPGLDMIGFVPYLVDTDSATIKSNLEELYKQHKEDNLVFQNIIKRSNKVSTWSKNGITEHKGYDKKVLSMYENVFFEMLERIIQLENEKE